MSRRTGTSVSRDLLGGWAGNSVSQDIERIRTAASPPTLQRAVVLDVIMDPNLLSAEQITSITNMVNNGRYASVMPANSIIARIINNAGGISARTNTILFPLFSSHFQLPVQPGEIVQVIYDDYSYGGQQLGYWMTRTSAQRTVEDVNYTHWDRHYEAFNIPAAFTSDERRSRGATQPGPDFPNGGNTTDTVTLAQSSSRDNPYETIISTATAYLGTVGNVTSDIPIVTPEAVPRWRKRPQEFVIQGANNSLIVLGEDRKGGPLGARAEQNPDAKGQAGTIDLVVGRGRILPEDNQDPNNSFTGNTAPFITENSRNNKETDKTRFLRVPGSSRLEDNATEGDPDLIRDAARIYVSMQTEADVNFGITDIDFTENSLPAGDNKNKIEQPNSGQVGTFNKSYIIGKADHLRLIARKDPDNSIDGTVLILREGDAEQDLCCIYLSKEGVHIDGPKIILGRGLADVADANQSPTPGGEPFIRWSKHRDTINRMQSEIDDLRSALQKQHDDTKTAIENMARTLEIAFNASIAVPYSPIAALQAIGSGQVITNTVVQPLTLNIQQSKQEAQQAHDNGKQDTDQLITDCKSTKIFGE